MWWRCMYSLGLPYHGAHPSLSLFGAEQPAQNDPKDDDDRNERHPVNDNDSGVVLLTYVLTFDWHATREGERASAFCLAMTAEAGKDCASCQSISRIRLWTFTGKWNNFNLAEFLTLLRTLKHVLVGSD